MARPIGKGNGFKDLTGQKFGRLMVIERDFKKQEERRLAGVKRHRRVYYKCLCDCGNITITYGEALRSGRVRSCGCLQKEFVKNSLTKLNSKVNEWNIQLDITYCSTNQNKTFIIDTEDLENIKYCYWFISSEGYVVNHYGEKLHRKIMKVTNNEIFVDHINGNRYDNRKSNLRLCNNQENCCNQNMSICNTSGFTGVSLHKKTGLWHSYIGYKNNNISLGYFKNKEDAIQARYDAEIKYFGEFSGELNRRKDYEKIMEQIRIEKENNKEGNDNGCQL